ncbi:MAG: PAS domain S-box protein [Ignavibacteriales bacterium]|nr:PAS domain S-box protein [Ignavibacteriales bacterium]
MKKDILHKEGEIIWALTTVSLMADFENKPLYFIVQVQDITKEKETKNRLLSMQRS